MVVRKLCRKMVSVAVMSVLAISAPFIMNYWDRGQVYIVGGEASVSQRIHLLARGMTVEGFLASPQVVVLPVVLREMLTCVGE
jgi:hypothetical protein